MMSGVIAHLAFWTILVIGLIFGGLRPRTAGWFVLLWLAAVFGFALVTPLGGFLAAPFVAILDVVLVLVVFKGDVRLS